MLKIIIRSQVIELCGFRNAVDDSACLRTLNGIVKHPVLFTDTESSDGTFSCWIINNQTQSIIFQLLSFGGFVWKLYFLMPQPYTCPLYTNRLQKILTIIDINLLNVIYPLRHIKQTHLPLYGLLYPPREYILHFVFPLPVWITSNIFPKDLIYALW